MPRLDTVDAVARFFGLPPKLPGLTAAELAEALADGPEAPPWDDDDVARFADDHETRPTRKPRPTLNRRRR